MKTDRPPEALAPLVRWPAERQRRTRVQALLGPAGGLRCLDVGGADGGLGWFLRQGGGDWSSVEPEAQAREELSALLGEPVRELEDGRLPFEDETFDAVVVADRLETLSDDAAFVRECHRVLKPAGRLVLHTAHAPRALALRPPPSRGKRRRADPEPVRRVGYTESELFEVLKDGFDVQEVAGYGRGFSELADSIGWRWVRHSGHPKRAAQWLLPPVWLVSRLDALLFFTRTRRLALRAKRRLWIPRHRPVLRDGRSIAEATLRTRIGTASPLAEAERPGF